HGKIKTDFQSNNIFKASVNSPVTQHPATAAGLGDFSLDSNTSGTLYNSPIADECQSNFIIYISNGPANENAAALALSETELSSLGYDTSSTIALTPNGQQGNWMDEWAKYMANADVNTSVDGDQHVYTYVVEVDPVTTGQGPAMTALLKSAALNGKGEYFAVSSGNSGQAIINALNSIFQEIQAVNSVFASTTLPVSVNVRGTNLNQVYIGVFRPDEAKQPRWFGNLKLYQLGFDTATSTLFLADAAGDKAENPETGFINSTAPSFWTESSAYWTFRTAEENAAGGTSDMPDGDLVEKGGTAEQQRISYLTDQDTRNLYTCTQGTVSPDCVGGSSLADTPFDTTNDGITAAGMQLGVELITTLTGFESKSVTALTDTRSVDSASTAASPVTVTILDSGSVSQSVSSLTTGVTRSLSSLSNSPVTKSISSISRGTGQTKNIATVTINNHGYSTGTIVHIAGVSASEYNGSFSITKIDDNQFKYDTGNSNPAANPSGGTATTTSSIVTATTSVAHAFTSGQSVTIAGVTPSDFNTTYTINVTSDTTFTFTTAAPLAPVTSVVGATAFGNTSTATATTPATHGYALNDVVSIAGASVGGYNITATITEVPTATTFRYAVSSALADASNAGITVSQGTTTVTATALGHLFADGQTVTITGGVPSGYNGSFTIFNSDIVAGTFQYTTASPQPTNTGTSMQASSGTTTQVTAHAPGHKFGTTGATVNVIIDGVTNLPAAYNGTVTATIVDDDSFTYPTEDGTAPVPATGTITARLSSATAFATVAAHGYGSAGDTLTVTISGANDADYNRSNVTATVVDADTIKYPLLVVTAQGQDSSSTILSSVKTTTARARVANHGFADGDSVSIAGATPSAFNGTFTITFVDANNFTYTLPSAQGNATGTLTASSGLGAAGELEDLIAWVRGTDNNESEDGDADLTDVRASIHGDVLHSRPAVVNYNRHGNDDDVYIFYGSNDGIFRAVKGGFNQSDIGEPEPGQEAWGFIPEEFFPEFSRLRDNEPNISSATKKPYFADGTIGTFTLDVGGDGSIVAADGDKVWLFISMRRGGRFLYALDVSDPSDPKLLWKKSNTDDGMAELGYTWSAPRVATLGVNNGDPVLVFGAGYDPTVEDVDPASITAITQTTVVAGAATYTRGMGRGIFVLDAETGDLLWQAGPADSDPHIVDPTLPHHFETVSGMDFAIPSDVVVITDRNGAIDNRAYVGDTGGNMWRIDMVDGSDTDTDNEVEDWVVTKVASISDHSTLPDGYRKFLFPPDVVYSDDGYDAVLIGSGDREHPFDDDVVNRFYMFKDEGISTSSVTTNLDEDDLFDATSNCIQDADACTGGDTPTTALAELESSDGWFITLGEGEKVVGNSVTLNEVTFFNTNQPSTIAGVTSCNSDLGVARQYKVLFSSAEAILDQNIDGSVDALDRSTVHPGGGYLPSPVPVVVEIDGQTHEGVISGVAVDEPPGSLLNARLRKFWFKEME
ncbi:MAG: hypothetical protein HYY36_07870, partial [Gammaproteobacteria bacterium]|nr:hypothetical protein [Gammaproteobacteria bacterium]